MIGRLSRLLLIAGLLAGCAESATSPEASNDATFKRGGGNWVEIDQSPIVGDLSDLNARLAEEKLGIQIAKYEYVTIGAMGEAGREVFASDRTKRLPYQWVAGDPRRGGATELYWTIDGTQGVSNSGIDQTESDQATAEAMQTWQDVKCSDIPLVQLPNVPFDAGVVQWLLGYGGLPIVFADYVHAGILPAAFFDLLAPDGGDFILGATFTFFCSDLGLPPEDADGDGYFDTCYTETYYNDAFPWQIDAPADPFGNIDFETVVLHEAGHALSQDHFGDIFFDGAVVGGMGGRFVFQHLHFAPYAVMNAAIWETQQELTGSDVAGHCSIWGNWPDN